MAMENLLLRQKRSRRGKFRKNDVYGGVYWMDPLLATTLAGEYRRARQAFRVRGLTFPPFHYKIALRTNIL